MSFGSYYHPMRPSQVALVVKNPPANTGDVRDAGLIPGWGKEMTTHSSSCLKNPMDRVAWSATVHRVAESDTSEAT